MSQNSAYFPFYVHPMDKKRSVQIIKQAKAEIKKMESYRPSTPFSSRIQTGINKDQLSRPSSSASIKSLKYESEENSNLPYRKLSLATNRKVGDEKIKLQPIVTKPILRQRRSITTCLKVPKEPNFAGFPPLPCEEKTKTLAVKSFTESFEIPDKDILHENEPSLENETSNFVSDTSNNSNELESLHSLSIRCDLDATTNEEPLKIDNEDKVLADNISTQLSGFFPLLERYIKLGRKKNEDDAVSVVKDIYSVLKGKKAFLLFHDNRIPLLKLLFRLLDTSLPVLSLNTVKLLLEMRIKDKNLASVFRLVSKLMKDEKIDLNECQLAESVVEVVSETPILDNSEVILYGIRIFKTLVCSNNVEMKLMLKCVDVSMCHLRDLNLMLPEERRDSNYSEIIALIISTLRCLIEDELMRTCVIKIETLTEILKVLACCSQSTENIQTILRLISKIIDKNDGCAALSQCPENLLLNFLSVLETYKYHIDTSLQIAFIIEHLVSLDEKTALAFVTSSNFVSTITVLGEYINEHIQFKDSVSDCFKSENLVSCGDRNWNHDILEVIHKVLCIWANICLHPNAGHYLAKRGDVINHLLDVVAAYSEKDGTFDLNLSLHSFLVVIGNISYYLESDSELCINIAKRVIPLLDDSFSFGVRFEAANIIRNLTRSSDVRVYIQEHSLLSAFIKLLNEDDKELCIGAYGIIMNLLIDEKSRDIFYKEEGVTRIIRKLHLCTDRDWKTSSLLCQILWNYCGGGHAEIIPVSKMEAQHLIKYLSYSTSNKENSTSQKEESDFYREWKTEFCPVAQKLLNLLKRNNLTNY